MRGLKPYTELNALLKAWRLWLSATKTSGLQTWNKPYTELNSCLKTLRFLRKAQKRQRFETVNKPYTVLISTHVWKPGLFCWVQQKGKVLKPRINLILSATHFLKSVFILCVCVCVFVEFNKQTRSSNIEQTPYWAQLIFVNFYFFI